MGLEIEVRGLEEIAANLMASIEQVRIGAGRGVERVAEAVRDSAQENVIASGAVDTGELLDKINTTPAEFIGDSVEAKVVASAPHALYIEMGTGPKGAANHAGIDPDVDPTYTMHGWVYPLKDGSGFRYTEGMPARPFMYPAKKMNEDKAEAIIADEIGKAVHNG
jgi:HK97 gp10 family phage protein